MGNESQKAVVTKTTASGLGLIIHYLEKILKPLLIAASVVACTALALMMVLTFLNVSGRVTLDLPIKGYFELIELGMLLMTVFAIGFTASKKGHIRVDILTAYIPKKVNRYLDILVWLIAFVFFVFVTWRGVVNGLDNLGDKLTTGVLHWPIYPFNFILAAGTALLALEFLKNCLQAINEVKE
jgi:TRAP-type C4-dicarboxylate transport system permease small subunit